MPRIDVAALRQRSSALFAGFTSGQKTMLGLAAVGTVIGALLFMRVSATTDYAPLYSNLTAQSASEITGALDRSGIEYQLADGGSTIRVPRSRVDRARLDLSAQGLPRDGAPGFDLLDRQGITASEFRQRVDYQRAMEGELARTIRTIEGVDAAIVHLVMPERDLFSNDSQHPSASVLVSTAPNRSLGAGQVQAVVHLVASSVEGLQAEHVTVADNAGRVLSASGPEGALAAAGDARATQTAGFEAALGARIQEIIAPVTGPNGARVTVTAQLDFDRRSMTRESFGEPGTAPVVQESTRTETFEGAGNPNAVGGVLGPDGLPIAAAAGEGSTYTQESGDRVFANDLTTEVIETAPGDVQRLSVAVLLDEAAAIDVRAVRQLVEASAGFDADRGDTVQVTQLPFDTSLAEQDATALAEARAAEQRSELLALLRTLAAVVIVAIVLLLAWRSHRKGVSRYPVAIPLDSADPDERGLPVAGRAAEGDGAHELSVPTRLEVGLDALTAGPSAADLEREELQGQISELIDRQPDDVAQVLRAWMSGT